MNTDNKPNILYVDDEIINLQLFKFTFRDNFNILMAKSGIEGLEIIDGNNDVDLVISDLKMSGMDGIEFVEKVKDRKNNLPCLLLTGYDKTIDIEEAINNKQIEGYILKPFKKLQVLESINTAIIQNNKS